MKLEQYINQLGQNLLKTYKSVEYSDNEILKLGPNCETSDYISRSASMEVEVEKIPPEITHEMDVVKIKFNVIPVRKRKPIKKDFYALLI